MFPSILIVQMGTGSGSYLAYHTGKPLVPSKQQPSHFPKYLPYSFPLSSSTPKKASTVQYIQGHLWTVPTTDIVILTKLHSCKASENIPGLHPYWTIWDSLGYSLRRAPLDLTAHICFCSVLPCLDASGAHRPCTLWLQPPYQGTPYVEHLGLPGSQFTFKLFTQSTLYRRATGPL